MSQHSISDQRPVTRGDAAVDGLFGGIAASLVMAAYLFGVVVLAGDDPAVFFAQLAPGDGASPISGLLLHIAVSDVYGAPFGVFAKRVLAVRPGSGAIAGAASGLVYGLGLLVVAKWIVLPATGSSLAQIPAVHQAVAHVAYGVVLGLLTAHRRAE